MTHNDIKIIEEVKATMRIEGMELDEVSIKELEDIANGKITIEESIKNVKEDILKKYAILQREV